MRYWFFYVLKHLDRLPKNIPQILRRTLNVENITFHWGNFINLLIKELQDELKSINKTQVNSHKGKEVAKRKPLFVINAIGWDVQQRNIAGYLKGIQHLANLLKGAIEDNKVQVLYLSGVAFPNKMTRADVNGYIFRAVNKIVLDIMQLAGVDTLDINSMLYSVNDYHVHGAHYLAVIPNEQTEHGKFGPGVADRIIHKICS